MINQVKSTTLVEGDPKVAFSIATPPRCRRERYSISRIAPLYLDPHLIVLSAEQDGLQYHFLSLCYDSTWDWTPDPRTIDEHSTHLANSPVTADVLTVIWPIPLKLLNTPTAYLQRGETPPTSVLYMILNFTWSWNSSNAGALENAEYLFIAIPPRSTLAQSGSTW